MSLSRLLSRMLRDGVTTTTQYGSIEDAITYRHIHQGVFRLKHGQSVLENRNINDSFIIGHAINGKIGNGLIIDDCDGHGNWNLDATTDATSLATETTIKKEGTASVSFLVDIDLAAGDVATIYKNISPAIDISAYTGVNSGDPLEGSVGIWIYVADTDSLKSSGNVVTLRIGSDSSNYTEYSKTKADLSDGWNYLSWGLPEYSQIVGTPVWTAMDYEGVSVVHSNTADFTFYIDYITISKQYETDFTNNSFENWTAGNPDNWAEEGTVTSTEETTEIKEGTSSLDLTVSGTDGNVNQTLPNITTTWIGRQAKIGAWVKTSTANLASLSYHDTSTGNVFGSTHTGGGGWEFLTVSPTIVAPGASSKCKMRTNGTGTAYFDYAIVVNPIAANGIGDRRDNWGYNNTTGFIDDFSSSTTLWKENSGTWSVSGGIYSQTNATGTHISQSRQTNFTDFQMRFKGRIDSLYVLLGIFRATGTLDHYRISTNTAQNKYNLEKVEGGVATVLSSVSFTMSMGTWYWWKIKCDGDRIKVWHSTNGYDWTLGINIIDTTYSSGWVGLGTIDSTASFDDFSVIPL